MLSILIPTYNNYNYLKLCIKSLEKNTKNKYEILIHVNDGSDGTLDFVKKNYLITLIQKKILAFAVPLIKLLQFQIINIYYIAMTICIFVLVGI